VASRRSSTRFILLSTLISIGVGCLVVASLGVWDYIHTTSPGSSAPSTETLTKTTETPDEKNPGPVAEEYSVPNDQPRAIRIPTLNIDAYVQRVGVDAASNRMVAPDNIYFTGWYVGSVAPGEAGVSIINGHAGGRYEQGVFRRIVGLKTDDSISVQMGDHRWREFKVKSATSYSTADAAATLFADDPSIERELHLITCDGVFDERSRTYDKRFIVTASLQKE
jgi:sortase (surface protein transpeptidase)